jgi:L-threonylcarbamoyladenylate synthase
VSYYTDQIDNKVISFLRNGGVGLLPTDTIYGLSCLALNENSVINLHHLKDRGATKPFVILISDETQLETLGVAIVDVSITKYWPGKMSMILDSPEAPIWLNPKSGTLAIRMPDHEVLHDLIEKVGPIISTSANISGEKPAQNISEAEQFFGDKLDFYVNAGEMKGQPSTIVKLVSGKLKIIRRGEVKINKKDLYDS